MTRLDHSRTNTAERMRRNGVDRIDDYGIPAGLNPPKRKPSKAAMRAEIEAATAKITRLVKCSGCGHSASIAVPPSKLRARFKCSRCGSLAQIGKEKPAGRGHGGLIKKRLAGQE